MNNKKTNNFYKKSSFYKTFSYSDDYINKDYEYYGKYYNKPLKQIIKEIYEEGEYKNYFDEEFNLTYVDEVKYLLHSIAVDGTYFNFSSIIKSSKNARYKIYEKSKLDKFNIDDVKQLVDLISPILNNGTIIYQNKFDTYNNYSTLKNKFLYTFKNSFDENIYTSDDEDVKNKKLDIINYSIKKHHLKYLIFMFKYFAALDIVIFKEQDKMKYYNNRLNIKLWGYEVYFILNDMDITREDAFKMVYNEFMEKDCLLVNEDLFLFYDGFFEKFKYIFYESHFKEEENIKVIKRKSFKTIDNFKTNNYIKDF